jgi:hypothetical protein
MSDTTQPSAPPPNAPAPPAAPQTEVPIDHAPVTPPAPIGDQAPPKPPGQQDNKSSQVSRREAIQQAFTRSKQAQEDAAKDVKPRPRPGMGHNQPPEPTEVEAKKPSTEKPTEKSTEKLSASQAAERYREGGKFARDPSKVEQQQPGQQQPQPGQQQARQLPETAPYREPPGRFRDQAKTEWHTTPESVRAGVYQMAKEFQGAYEKYRGDNEVMNELRPYHDLATKQGTSLRRAFDNYYGMEQKLRSDLVGGLDVIVQNLRLNDPNTGRPITLHDVAHHIVNMTPEQHQLTAQRNQQTSSDQRIGQLHQQVEQQNQILSQLLYQQKFAGTRAQVDQFAEAHPRFDELADLIKSELDLGFPLEVAYQRADRLRPNPQAAQTRTQSAQTRKTSISGAPDGNGSSSVTPRPSDGQRRTNGEAKHPTRREAIAKAMRRVGNGV